MTNHFRMVVLLSLGVVMAGCSKATPPNADQNKVEMERFEERAAELIGPAELGDVGAQFSLGMMHESGQGVPQDDLKAVEWYQKAAAQGNADAQNNLGAMYETGKGVAKDAAKAAEWYQKAAAKGNANAQFNLGAAHFRGQGAPKDDVKAVEWWQKAAAQGHANAQLKLGAMYYTGSGARKDWVLAYTWIDLATAKTNNPKHRKARDIIGKELKPEELSEALSLFSSWKMGEVLKRKGE